MAIYDGGSGDDSWTGTSDADQANGHDGGDSLSGLGGEDTLDGGAGDDTLDGGDGNDLLVAGTGLDRLIGGSGNDRLYFGAAFGGSDLAGGGDGTDTLILQGNYVALLLAAANLTGVEGVSLQSGSVTRWGQAGTASYDFAVSAANDLLAAGQQLRLNAQSLLAGEDFAFDGSAETDGGRFLVYGGFGTDDFVGGSGNDIFFFEAARFGQLDSVSGGGGNDAVVISGAPSGSHYLSLTIKSGALDGIEALSFNGRFASDPAARPLYFVTLENGNIAANGTLIVNASSLDSSQLLSFDGSQSLQGRMRIFGGAGDDTFYSGLGSDVLQGGGGRDELTGGEGADIFQYVSLSDSAGADIDVIFDFEVDRDRIDLAQIDADSTLDGDQAFVFLEKGAFTRASGQLRYQYDFEKGHFVIEADVDGDGGADFQIHLINGVGMELIAADFVL